MSNDNPPFPFGRECYVVRGTDNNGNFWMSRRFFAPNQYPTLDDARRSAEQSVSRMNSLGASVVAVQQALNDDGMTWSDLID